MRSKPTVSTQFTKILISFCDERGLDVGQLAQSVKLDSHILNDPEERIDYVLFSELFAEAEGRTNLESFGVLLGKRAVEYSSGHILISMMRSCATIEDAMTRMLRYHGLVSDAFSFDVESQGEHLTITLREDQYIPQLPASETEQIFTMLVLLLASLTSQPTRPRRIFFRHPEPLDITPHKEIMGDCVSFGKSHNQMWFDAASLRQPLPMADPEFQQAIERIVDKRIRDRATATTWTARSERQLYRTLSKGDLPGFDALAKDLGLSGKTLRRSLKSEGTNFKNVLDAVREEMSKALLGRPEMSLFDVALLLGYAEQSTFNHAFRRWTGMSPSEFRKTAN